MALQGPFAVIADSPAPEVVDALRAAGGFPIIETNWTEAPTALAAVEPEGIVLADACPNPACAAALTDLLGEQRDKGNGLFMPVIARTRDDGAPSIPDAFAIAANAPPQRLVRRLATALRIRTLHGTVLRRMRTLHARDIDGMVIGDGFGPKIVEALLTVLAEDARFRDLPVAVLGGHPAVLE